MSMLQDHDMDELFRQKLDGFEIAPSKNSWASIASEMAATAPRKKRIVPVLRIAASVTVLLGLGLYIWIAKDKIPGKSTGNNVVAVNTPATHHQPVDAVPAAVNQQAQQGIVAIKPVTSVTQISAQFAARKQLKPIKGNVEPMQSGNTAAGGELVAAADLKPVNTIAQQTVLAAVAQVNIPVNTAELPDAAALKARSVIDTGTTFKPSPAVLAMVNKPKATDKTPRKRHGFHNMGDLFNIMIASVDKRADKLVVFSEKDDESSITGVNLGFIKIKKDK